MENAGIKIEALTGNVLKGEGIPQKLLLLAVPCLQKRQIGLVLQAFLNDVAVDAEEALGMIAQGRVQIVIRFVLRDLTLAVEILLLLVDMQEQTGLEVVDLHKTAKAVVCFAVFFAQNLHPAFLERFRNRDILARDLQEGNALGRDVDGVHRMRLRAEPAFHDLAALAAVILLLLEVQTMASGKEVMRDPCRTKAQNAVIFLDKIQNNISF